MSKNTGIDLDEIDVAKSAEVGFEFEIEHPTTGEGIGVFITVRGEEAASVRLSGILAASESIVRESMKANAKPSKQSFDQQVQEKSAELQKIIEEDTPERAAQRVIAWRGVKRAGADLPFTVPNCVEFFKKLPFAQLQVLEQSRNLGNFFKMPQPASAPTRQKSSN